MRPFLIALAVSFALAGCTLYSLVSRAEAQAAADGQAQLNAGPSDKPLAAAPAVVVDPVNAPAQAFDELKAARKIGWPVAVLVGLTMALLAAGHLGIAWLKKGARAFVLAAATTTLTAAALAALDGGSWMAIVSAAVAAGLGYWTANRTHVALVKASLDA